MPRKIYVCRFPGCLRTDMKRFKTCGKHARWIARGFFSIDLQPLKPLTARMARLKICRIRDCEFPKHKIVKGFCEKHYRRFLSGVIDETGKELRELLKNKPYAPDMSCFMCGKRGKIVKGFCNQHYAQFRKGYIDFDGFSTGKKKKLRYDDLSFCKIKGCSIKARCVGFCRKHYESYRNGTYDVNGNVLRELTIVRNQGKQCKAEGCSEPAHCKEYCRPHYSRFSIGAPLEKEYVNKDQPCSVPSCRNEAKLKGFCWRHHRRLMLDRPMIKDNTICQYETCFSKKTTELFCPKHHDQFSKGRICTYGNCFRGIFRKRMCFRHYATIAPKCKLCEEPVRNVGLCNHHYEIDLEQRKKHDNTNGASSCSIENKEISTKLT